MPADGIINITDILTYIIGDAVSSIDSFNHIKMKHLLVCVGSNKSRTGGGTYGKLVPMKFINGEEVAVYKGKMYAIPQLYHQDERILYLIYFYMPKFFDLGPLEKLKVIFHELYHINPTFNGDIRRLGKVKSAHGFSREHFNEKFKEDVMNYHTRLMGSDLYGFLELNSESLHGSFQKVYARRIVMPRPIVISGA